MKKGSGIVLEKGSLKGSFRGFKNRDTVFQFSGGRKWRQAQYKYLYHYAYRPQAQVVQQLGRTYLYVDGASDYVEVVPA
jgi:hypothetical protein